MPPLTPSGNTAGESCAFALAVPPYIGAALGRLQNAGFEAYVVGGCVRDALLGVPPHDWDITTAASPREVKRLFAGCRQADTGIRHGTVLVVLDGRPVEITTFRVDGAYSDGRRPDSVSFTHSIREDLARRDFTINACAATGNTLIDPFGGREDAAGRILRCVGDPEQRFQEDALRILRGVRFAATLGFAVEERTRAAMHARAGLLAVVSAERIAQELLRTLTGPFVRPVLLEFRDIIALIVPELVPCMGFDQRSPWHVHDVYTHMLAAVEQAPPDSLLREALFLHDIAKPRCFTADAGGAGHFPGHAAQSAAMAEEILRRLKRPAAETAAVRALVAHHDDFLAPAPGCMRRLLARLGPENAARLLRLRRADILAQNPALAGSRLEELARLEAALRAELAKTPPLTVRDLAVGGGDLMALGIPPGKRMGEILRGLFGLVLDGTAENRREPLLEEAKRLAARL